MFFKFKLYRSKLYENREGYGLCICVVVVFLGLEIMVIILFLIMLCGFGCFFVMCKFCLSNFYVNYVIFKEFR